jgi:predicted phage terminase large subunit-like protein
MSIVEGSFRLTHAHLSNVMELAKRQTHNSFMNFIKVHNPKYKFTWFHKQIIQACEDIANGKISKLILQVPPQYGKSTIVSHYLPAWLLARDPSLNICSVSYNQAFSAKNARKVREIMSETIYTMCHNIRLPALNEQAINQATEFETMYATELYRKMRANTSKSMKCGGSYISCGIGTALTGRSVDIGLIDDPIKDRAEAESLTTRDSIWDWFNDVFNSRFSNNENKPSAHIILMTRWHEDDLIGRCLKRWSDYKVISFPAIKEDNSNPSDPREIGEALWPSKHPLENILEIKQNNPYTFSSLYQQRPSSKNGNLFKRDAVKYYNSLPNDGKVIISVDANYSEGSGHDNCSIDVWGWTGKDSYLIDHYAKPVNFSDAVIKIEQFYKKYKPSAVLIENKANGGPIMTVLREKIPAILSINPRGSKVARAEAICDMFNAGNVFIPNNEMWTKEWVEEVITFPNAKHDDRVDSMTQALFYFRNLKNISGGFA